MENCKNSITIMNEISVCVYKIKKKLKIKKKKKQKKKNKNLFFLNLKNK